MSECQHWRRLSRSIFTINDVYNTWRPCAALNSLFQGFCNMFGDDFSSPTPQQSFYMTLIYIFRHFLSCVLHTQMTTTTTPYNPFTILCICAVYFSASELFLCSVSRWEIIGGEERKKKKGELYTPSYIYYIHSFFFLPHIRRAEEDAVLLLLLSCVLFVSVCLYVCRSAGV